MAGYIGVSSGSQWDPGPQGYHLLVRTGGIFCCQREESVDNATPAFLMTRATALANDTQPELTERKREVVAEVDHLLDLSVFRHANSISLEQDAKAFFQQATHVRTVVRRAVRLLESDAAK